MSDVVADSSVVAKWLLPEPDSAAALQVLSDSVTQGHRIVVLDLAVIEVANAIWRRVHRKLIDVAHGERLLDELIRIPVQIQPAGQLLKPAFTIAVKHDRSIYDALFVAACDALSLPGVTADEPLVRAVQQAFPSIRLLGQPP
jgi:predicted nucleic acid-binding protein